MKIKCSGCGAISTIRDAVVKQARRHGISVECSECGANISLLTSEPQVVKRNDNKKRSEAQERRSADRYGARVQPASGALGGAKGDFRKADAVRGENKCTRARSITLHLDDLLKIEGEAAGTEVPILEIEFQGVYPIKSYTIIPSRQMQALMDELAELRRKS